MGTYLSLMYYDRKHGPVPCPFRLFFANFAVDNKILNHYNMKAKVVDNRYLFF